MQANSANAVLACRTNAAARRLGMEKPPEVVLVIKQVRERGVARLMLQAVQVRASEAAEALTTDVEILESRAVDLADCMDMQNGIDWYRRQFALLDDCFVFRLEASGRLDYRFQLRLVDPVNYDDTRLVGDRAVIGHFNLC